MSTPFCVLLGGENSRGSGDSQFVLIELQNCRDRMAELLDCLEDAAPLVRARAMAILERLSRDEPELASLASRQLLLNARPNEHWLNRMNVARMMSRVQWREADYEAVLAFLFDQAESDSGFVAAWSLNSLALLAQKDVSLRPRVLFMLEDAIATGKPAVRSRARSALSDLRKI